MSKNCTNDGCNCTPNSAIKCSVTSLLIYFRFASWLLGI